MEQLTVLKATLHSRSANLYNWKYCRVLPKNGWVLYLTEEKKQYCYISIANTAVFLLGTGKFIAQAAKSMLASAEPI